MREIKFRGKNPDGYWIEGDLIHKALTVQSMIVDCGIAEDGCYPIEVMSKTVGQFTGLKDKNGKEIYEGDITSLDGEYLAVIKWDEKKASFVVDSIEGDCVSEHLYGAELCAVEGNIYENPELLEAD